MDNGLTRRVFWILAGSAALAVTAIAFLSVTMASSVNKLAREDRMRLVASALNGQLEQLQVLTVDYANWTEGYDWIVARDDDAVYSNFGTGATDSPAFDFMSIIDSNGTPLYAYADGGEASDISVHDGPALAPMFSTVRASPVEAYAAISGFVRTGTGIGLVSMARIQPMDMTGVSAADLPVLATGLHVSPDFLTRIGAGILLSGLQLHEYQPDAAALSSLPLRDSAGTPVAWVSWPAPRPGSDLLARGMPLLLGTTLILIAGILVVGRASARQSASFVRERIKARTDTLTGLLNRSGLNELVATAEVAAAIEKGHAAVLYLDLNGFKKLNDTVGHDGGDRALVATGERLRRSMRHADTIARLGGDEFVALILDEAPEETARTVCERILMQTEIPLRFGKTDTVVRASIGVAIAGPGAHWDDLLIRADAAMYRAKRERLVRPVFDSPSQRATSSPLSLRTA